MTATHESPEPDSMPLVIRVLQHDFPIDREFVEGHILTASEAAAMSQLLVENVRNNVYGWVTREARGKATLTPEQHAELTKRISDYADKYQFKTRTKSKPANPLDATVKELAWQHAEAWASQHGHEYNGAEMQKRYLDLRHAPSIYTEARQLILSRQLVADEALEGLL